jgi:hypothetical protein
MPHPVHSSFLFLYVSSKNSTRFLLLLVELFSIFDPVCLFLVIESALKVCRSNSDTPCIDKLLVMLVLLVAIVQKYTNESDISAKKSLTFLSLLYQTSLLGVMYLHSMRIRSILCSLKMCSNKITWFSPTLGTGQH